MLEKTLESPLDCKEIQPVNPKGNQSWIFIVRTDAEAEAPPDENWLVGKDPDAGKDWRQEEKGTTESEMVVWHHQLDGHEFEQALGVGDGQGSLACCSSWRHNWATELNWTEQSPTIWTHFLLPNNDYCDWFDVNPSSFYLMSLYINIHPWDFPGSPVSKISPSNAGDVGSIPGWGNKIPHALQPKNQNIKQKQYCNKLNKKINICPCKKHTVYSVGFFSFTFLNVSYCICLSAA